MPYDYSLLQMNCAIEPKCHADNINMSLYNVEYFDIMQCKLIIMKNMLRHVI